MRRVELCPLPRPFGSPQVSCFQLRRRRAGLVAERVRAAFFAIPPLGADLLSFERAPRPAPRSWLQVRQALPEFDRLEVRDGLTVRVEAGKAPELSLDASADALGTLRFRLERGTLVVHRAKGKSAPLELCFRLPALRGIELHDRSVVTVDGVGSHGPLELHAYSGSRLHWSSFSAQLTQRITVCNVASHVSLDACVTELYLEAVCGAQTTLSGAVRTAELFLAEGSRLEASGCFVDQTVFRVQNSQATLLSVVGARGAATQGSELGVHGPGTLVAERRHGSVVTRKSVTVPRSLNTARSPASDAACPTTCLPIPPSSIPKSPFGSLVMAR